MAIAERELITSSHENIQHAEPKAPEEFTPQPYRWTREQFYAMGDAGLFEGRRAILVEGEILTMPGMKEPHRTAIALTAEVLRSAFAPDFLSAFSVRLTSARRRTQSRM